MTDQDAAAQRFVHRPEEATGLRGWHDPNCPLILDFDETLWLRNSTEEFFFQSDLGYAQKVALRLVQRFGPWRLSKDRSRRMHLRDWMRVRCVVGVKPSIAQAWTHVAASIGPRYANPHLIELARDKKRKVVVASNGFDFIVRPLMNSMNLDHVPLIAAPLSNGARWRIRGKLANIEAVVGHDLLVNSMFVTDSSDDLDALEVARDGYLIRWHEAEFRPFKP